MKKSLILLLFVITLQYSSAVGTSGMSYRKLKKELVDFGMFFGSLFKGDAAFARNTIHSDPTELSSFKTIDDNFPLNAMQVTPLSKMRIVPKKEDFALPRVNSLYANPTRLASNKILAQRVNAYTAQEDVKPKKSLLELKELGDQYQNERLATTKNKGLVELVMESPKRDLAIKKHKKYLAKMLAESESGSNSDMTLNRQTKRKAIKFLSSLKHKLIELAGKHKHSKRTFNGKA